MRDAYQFARKGIRVMPVHGLRWKNEKVICTCGNPNCNSAAKHPIFNKWQNIVENDQKTIDAWFGKYPEANLGAITGRNSGIIVLDIDPKNGGDESFARMLNDNDEIPETPTVITGSGGRHFYFKHPGGVIHNRTRFDQYDGIDIRGDGGFVVAPHSRHLSGSNYEWEVPLDFPMADVPVWMLRKLNKKTANKVEASITGKITTGSRNDTIAKMLGKVIWAAVTEKHPWQFVAGYAIQMNKMFCVEPLEQEEIIKTVKSLYKTKWRSTYGVDFDFGPH